MRHHDHGTGVDVHVYRFNPDDIDPDDIDRDYDAFDRTVERYALDNGAHVIVVHPYDHRDVGLSADIHTLAASHDHRHAEGPRTIFPRVDHDDCGGGDLPGTRPGCTSHNDPDGDDGRRDGDDHHGAWGR